MARVERARDSNERTGGPLRGRPEGRRRIVQVAAGTVQLDFTIQDSTGEMIDREQRTVTVPDLAKTTLALTTPVISRARSAAEFRSLSRIRTGRLCGPRFLPVRSPPGAGRAVWHGAADAEVTAQLVGPRGTTLAELPIHAEGEGGGFRLDLPLSSLATGEFLIAIAARTPAERVETLVPLRISSVVNSSSNFQLSKAPQTQSWLPAFNPRTC